MKKNILFLCASLLCSCGIPTGEQEKNGDEVTVAVFAINDFHGAFVRNDHKNVPGAPAVWQTIDSLKQIYPHHLVVAAGDNFGGSYFYNATKGILLPSFFNGLGLRISALGNHEFDNGQDALRDKWSNTPMRPEGWDISYLCANVRDTTGQIPSFAQPFISDEVTTGDEPPVKIGLVGLIASSTPQQTSKSRLKGLTFDGNYPAVLDSIARLPDYKTTVADADIRLLLTHIGTKMTGGKPAWDDADSDLLTGITGETWHGILSAHTHQPVCGTINATSVPVVQGLRYGEYISILKFRIDRKSRKVTSAEPELCRVNPAIKLGKGPERLQEQIDSLLLHTKTKGGAALGEYLTTAAKPLIHDRDDRYRQTPTGTLVCQSFAEAYRKAAALTDEDIIVGTSHFGSIRAGFSQGPVTVMDVGEALPFSNAIKVYRMNGKQLRHFVDYGLHNKRFGYLQTAWLDIECTGKDTTVTGLTYVSPSGKRTRITDQTPCFVATDEFITTGGDGYLPSLFPAGQEVKITLPATTDAFINYLKTLKQIGE